MGLSVRKVMRERWGRKQNNIQVREGITCDHTRPPCKKKTTPYCRLGRISIENGGAVENIERKQIQRQADRLRK